MSNTTTVKRKYLYYQRKKVFINESKKIFERTFGIGIVLLTVCY